MNNIVIYPIIFPFACALLGLLGWGVQPFQRLMGFLGSFLLLLSSIFLFYHVYNSGVTSIGVGSWVAPFGIVLVSDLFSSIMVLITGIMGCTIYFYSLFSSDHRLDSYSYYPLYNILLGGVAGAFLTGDIFNLYVFFEVMLIASFVLMAQGGQRTQMEGAFKYVTMNLISSILFLSAIGVLYGLTGTLNMADLSQKLAKADQPAMMSLVAVLFFSAFGIKSAIFPLYSWLPASYHTPPFAVTALFASLLTKVGLYALIRIFSLLFTQSIPFTHTLILVVAGVTMVLGVFGAVVQTDFRKILSFHMISQNGYMLMGLGLFTSLSLAGGIFYFIHYIFVKANLFLISGVVYHLRQSTQLKQIGGVYRSHPLVAGSFFLAAFSLAGFPPFSGFVAKFLLVKAGLGIGTFWIVFIALFVSLMTLMSMAKIWNEVFWKKDPEMTQEESPKTSTPWGLMMPVGILTVLSIAVAVFAGPILEVTTAAAEQLLQPEEYIEAVMGGTP